MDSPQPPTPDSDVQPKQQAVLPLADVIGPRTLLEILRDACQLYGQHWVPFTWAVAPVVIMKLLGTLWCLYTPFVLTHVMGPLLYDLTGGNMVLAMGVMFVAIAPGLYLFCRGFWGYMVLMTSLNRNVVEVLQGEQPDFSGAYHLVHGPTYTTFLLVIASIWMAAAAPVVLVFPLARLGSENPTLWGVLLLLAFGLTAVLMLAAAGVALFWGLVFQLFTLEPQLTAPGQPLLALVKRCTRLVGIRHVGRVLLLTLATGVVTSMVAPFAVNLVLDLFQITRMVSPMAQYLSDNLISGLVGGGSDSVLTTLQQFVPNFQEEIARELIHEFVGMAVTLLMLPLGTIAFCLLYLDCRAGETETVYP